MKNYKKAKEEKKTSLVGWWHGLKKLFSLRNLARGIIPFFLVNDSLELSQRDIDHRWQESFTKWVSVPLVLSFFLGVLLVGIVVYGVYLSLIKTYNTTFNIDSVTEQLVLKTYPNTNLSPWVIEDALVKYGCDDEGEIDDFNGILEIKPGVNAVLQRIAYGTLYISLEYEYGSTVGNLYDNNEKLVKQLPECTYITMKDFAERAKNGRTSLFLLSGKLYLGEELKNSLLPGRPLLKSGNVTITEKKFGSDEFYTMGPYPISIGAYVKVQKSDDTNNSAFESLGQGFVTINSEEAMHVVYHENGKNVTVSHYKTEPYVISNGFFKRLTSESGQAYLWLAALIIYGVIRLLLRFALK